MKRRTGLVAGIAVALVALIAIVLLLQTGWIRRSGDELGSLLATQSAVPGMPADPTAAQAWVVNAVRDATGRELEIEGVFDAYLLPLPGLLLGKASLGNEEGFGDLPFAMIDGMELRVGSFNLFSRRLHIERAALAGLRLNFARKADGASNWSDFGDNAGSAVAPGQAPGASAGSSASDWTTSFDVFEIIDGEVSLQDAFAGVEWKLSGFDFRVSDLRPGEPFPVAWSFDFASGEKRLSFAAELRALSTASQLELEGIELAFSRFAAADLVSVLESLLVDPDPEILRRAGSSSSVHFSGAGTIDSQTGALELQGGLRLIDGPLAAQLPAGDPSAADAVPLTIGGTLERPRITLD